MGDLTVFDTASTPPPNEFKMKVLVFFGERCRIVQLEAGGKDELLSAVRRLFKLPSQEIILQVSQLGQ